MEKQFLHRDPASIKKLQTALTAEGEELFQLVLDPDITFVRTLLKNPSFTEEHLLTLLKRHDLTEDLTSTIYQKYRHNIGHRIVLGLVRNSATPGVVIRNLLPQLRLFELVDLLKLPHATPDQKLAAERVILQRLPTTPLGNKMTLARRGTSAIISELLKEGVPQVFDICLSNSQLKEAAIFQYLRGAKANAETISMIARHNRWNQRPNLRLAILKNHRTPAIWFTLWLPKLTTHLLKNLHHHHKTHPEKRHLIDLELKKRGLI
jgi:hypothetical protein